MLCDHPPMDHGQYDVECLPPLVQGIVYDPYSAELLLYALLEAYDAVVVRWPRDEV